MPTGADVAGGRAGDAACGRWQSRGRPSAHGGQERLQAGGTGQIDQVAAREAITECGKDPVTSLG